jgi:hypothetical protein
MAETIEQKMARTGQSRVDIEYAQNAQQKAKDFANKVPTSVNATDLTGATDFKTIEPVLPNTGSDLMSGINAMTEQSKADAQAKQQAEDARLKAGMDAYSNAQMIQGTDPNQTERTELTTGLTDLYGKQAESKQALGEAYKAGGVDAFQKRLQELNLQSAQLQGSYLQGITNAEGQTIPMQFITGQQAQIQKQYAVKAASVALEQQAIQGNIANAKQIAQEMVDLEYGDIEAQIAQQKDLIDLNYQNLTTSQKNRADALTYALTQEQNRIDEEKAEKQRISDVALKYAESGNANSATFKSILESDSEIEALYLTGGDLTKFAEDKLLSPTEAATLGVPYGTTQKQAAAQGAIPKAVLTPVDKIKQEFNMSKQVDTSTKESNSAKRQIGIMEAGYK